MQRKIVFSEGEYYHIYNRGVEKRKIFLDEYDRQRFVRLLYLANGTEPYKFDRLRNKKFEDIQRGKSLVAIGAYVLMPNHFHLLVKEVIENGISMFMEKLTTGYSSYFNKKYQRVGPLFLGVYKGEYITRDEHLKYLLAYIHLNPIKLTDSQWKEKGLRDLTKSRDFLTQYKYSSYPDYCGVEREEQGILSLEHFPKYFNSKLDFKDFVDDWLTYKTV